MNLLSGELQRKITTLEHILAEMGSVLVGFSGGVDSSVVAVMAQRVLGERALAVTAASPVEIPGEADQARRMAEAWGLHHEQVYVDDLQDATFAANPVDRCYHCKLRRFGDFRKLASERGLAWLADGTNADDHSGYRPGVRALNELGVRSPLREAGLVKAEVRQLAHALGLEVWDKPAAPCLATRFPYDTPLTHETVARVGQAERFLHDLGYPALRVRVHNDLARLEIPPGDFERLLAQRQAVITRLGELGFKQVTLDLQGLRSGSWDALDARLAPNQEVQS